MLRSKDFVEFAEINSGVVNVETAGYRPLPVLIRSLEVAGEQLSALRAEMYDYGDWDESKEKIADNEYVDTDPDALIELSDQLQFSEIEGSFSGGDSGESGNGDSGEPLMNVKESSPEGDE